VGQADLTLEKVVQHNESDYAFLSEKLANKYGFEFFVTNGIFHFRNPHPLAAPIVPLEYGKSLQSFSPNQENADQSVGTAEVRGWNPNQKSAITASASVPEGGNETDVRRVAVESQQEAQRIAEAAGFDLTPASSGRCETIGLPEIREGVVVMLAGLGLNFSGLYYVESTTHRMDESGYTTTFQARQADLFEGLL
jgi:phage protein D